MTRSTDFFFRDACRARPLSARSVSMQICTSTYAAVPQDAACCMRDQCVGGLSYDRCVELVAVD